MRRVSAALTPSASMPLPVTKGAATVPNISGKEVFEKGVGTPNTSSITATGCG
jgi:hypothetical protein